MAIGAPGNLPHLSSGDSSLSGGGGGVSKRPSSSVVIFISFISSTGFRSGNISRTIAIFASRHATLIIAKQYPSAGVKGTGRTYSSFTGKGWGSGILPGISNPLFSAYCVNRRSTFSVPIDSPTSSNSSGLIAETSIPK